MVRQRVPEVEVNRTMQALYDFIVSAVREQGRPSMTPSGCNCAYHGTDGAKCAVGHLIPPSEYRAMMEGNHVTNEVVWKAVRKNPLVKAAIKANSEDAVEELLSNMQQAHDDAADDDLRGWVPFVDGFLDRVSGVGEVWNLDLKETA